MPTPVFTVRHATAADIPALVNLINAAFAVEKGDFKVDERITPDELEEYFRRGVFLIAEAGDESARAMLACVFVEVLNPAEASRSGGIAYFGLLAVDPQHQRRGLGNAMTAQAEAWALKQGCHAIELDTLDVRPELPPIYERMGYRIISVRPSPAPERFIKPVQFVRMRKQLNAGGPAQI